VVLAEPGTGAGAAAWAVAEQLARRGLAVIPALTGPGLADDVAALPGVGAVLVDWEPPGGGLAAVLDGLGALADPPPAVLLSEHPDEPAVPPGAAGQARGCFWLGADSPGFVARQVERLVAGHADTVAARLVAELDGYLRPAGRSCHIRAE
jgi:hypothetical protein